MPTKWTPAMSVGNEEIDADHMRLIRIINDFEKSPDLVHAELAARKLFGYAEEHFLREEAMLKRAGFAGLAHHAAAHRHILDELKAHIRDYFLQPRGANADEVIWQMALLMHDWIVSHVLTFDQGIKASVSDTDQGISTYDPGASAKGG
jgi:hemerythrin